MKTKRFFDKVFVVDVVALSGTKDEINKWLKKEKSDYKISEGVKGFCRREEGKAFWVYISNPLDFYALLHEVIHLVGMITDRNGVGACLMRSATEVDETLAYYLSYWFKELWRFYGKLKKGNK